MYHLVINNSVNTVLLIQVAAIILLSMLLQRMSTKFGAPYLLAILLLGLLLGNYGVVQQGYISYSLAQQVCETALIFIMFYGGFDTRWLYAKRVLGPSALLASVGVVSTCALVALFCHFVIHWNWAESMLLGAVLSSTDAASVFVILKEKKLNLSGNITPLIEVESGSNDPMSHMLTLIVISVIKGGMGGGSAILLFLMETGIGIGAGVLIAILARIVLRNLSIRESLISLFFFAVAVLSFAIPDVLGGNGYLSAYMVGLLLGQESFRGKKAIVHFFEGITGLMEMLLFFILGALARPASFPKVILPALAIFFFLLLVARPLAINSLLLPFQRFSAKHRAMVSFAGIRGAAAIVFAVIALNQARPENDILNIVFCIVLLSIGIQGSLLPNVAKWLGIVESSSNPQSFNEFAEEDLQFGRLTVTESSGWCGKTVQQTELPEGLTIAVVVREGEPVIPYPDMVLLAGDTVITISEPFEEADIKVRQKVVKAESRRVGRPMKDYPGSSTILLVKRDGKNIIPSPDTVLLAGDTLYILNV